MEAIQVSGLCELHAGGGQRLMVVSFNVNLWYSTGDLAWIITAGSFVWLMIPGVGFFYSGLSRQKSALSVILLSFISLSVVTFQVHPFVQSF